MDYRLMNKRKSLSLLMLLSFFSVLHISLTAQDSVQEAESQYEKNILKRYINDVYIPKDMEDCFVELKRLSAPSALQIFKNGAEEQVAKKLHFGLGKWMSVNWNFYEGSRFSHYLKLQGVSHPDDMVQFTIVSFHRHINGMPLQLKERAESYYKIRKEAHLARLNAGKTIATKKRKKQ